MIRRAVVADAEALAAVQVAGWHWAYADIMPPEVLAAMTVEARRPRWHDILADGSLTLVWEGGDGIDGFVSGGPTRDADCTGAGEVYALYVAQGSVGQGIGRALLDGAVEVLGGAGHQRFVLWVLRDNEPARAFYERVGWRFDGTEKVSPWGPVEVRYELPR